MGKSHQKRLNPLKQNTYKTIVNIIKLNPGSILRSLMMDSVKNA